MKFSFFPISTAKSGQIGLDSARAPLEAKIAIKIWGFRPFSGRKFFQGTL